MGATVDTYAGLSLLEGRYLEERQLHPVYDEER
jgi:hypothetical protein